MMTCSATWNSVDDCIMKNSLEAGGTMEAIAAGIMPMSRSYTYKELEERWLLMLYDPDVSALASAGMLEVELSGTCPTTKSIKLESYKGYQDLTAKRKRSSIRKQYYAMRKKSRVQFISSADLSLLDVPEHNESHNQVFISREPYDESFIPNDLGLQEDDLDLLRSVFPETITDYDSSSYFRDTSNEYPAECPMANGIIKNEFPHEFSNSVREDERDSLVEAAAPKCFDISVVSDGDFMDLSESLLNFAIEDEMTLMGTNELDAIDETLTDYLPASVHKVGKIKCEPATLMVEEPGTGVFNCTPPTTLETVASFPQNEQTTVRHINDSAPSSVINEKEASTSGTSTKFHEPNCSVICCILNTEVLEVPSNDDIFLLIHDESSPSSPSSSGDALDETSTATGETRLVNLSGREKYGLDSLPLHPNLRSSRSQDCAVKSKSIDPKVAPLNPSKPPSSSNHYKSSGDNFSRPQLKVEGTMASLEDVSICAEGDFLKEHALQQAINGEASDSEESQSDEDPPCTSDVENMILEMGFDPAGKENPIGMEHRISGRVRYLSEDTKRTIMRLEQCYQTVMRRRLSRQGAFAILYGRRLKHYIRKTKVVVGRSADDVDVDIDLSQERSAKRVSRQQAIIKLEANGFFSLKNIGRCDVSINGEKVLVGQTRILSSGCLIEIASMGFVFEINEKYVRRYMDTTAHG